MTKVISDKKELKKLSLEEKIENVKNGLRNNSILCEKYIKNNATLLESFRQIVNLPNVRNLGELFWLLGEVGERGYKPLAKMEDFDFERLVFKKNNNNLIKLLLKLLDYPELSKPPTSVINLENLNTELMRLYNIDYSNKDEKRIRYTDNYIIEKRLAPIYVEMADVGVSPTEQDRFIIEIFTHFKYLGYEGNQTESDKLNSVRKYRERSVTNHTVK